MCCCKDSLIFKVPEEPYHPENSTVNLANCVRRNNTEALILLSDERVNVVRSGSSCLTKCESHL